MSGFFGLSLTLAFYLGLRQQGMVRRGILFAITTTSCNSLMKKKHGAQLLAKSLVSSTKFKSITWEC